MPALSDHFALLRKRIEPDAERVQKAQEMPAKVRYYLENHEGFPVEEPCTRLAGSYARHTAITKLKDVDILVFADQSWREKPISEMLNALKKVLEGLPAALDDCGPVTIRHQRRSVNVILNDHDLSLDIVPVLKTTAKLTDQLEVPDRAWDDYVFSHPLGYGCYLSDLNGENSNKIVPLVKMFKQWRDTQFPVKNRPKSYWLESMVVQHVRRGWLTTANKGDGTLFADFCEALYSQLSPTLEDTDETPFIPDGALRNHVAWNWRRSAFETFMRRLDETRKSAKKAIEVEDEAEAVRRWKEIFGDSYFPSTAEVEKENQASEQNKNKSLVGGFFVSQTGQVLAEKPSEQRTVASPGKRFFGDI